MLGVFGIIFHCMWMVVEAPAVSGKTFSLA